jgi:hypothetical protein
LQRFVPGRTQTQDADWLLKHVRNSLKRAKNFRSFRQRVNQNSKESVFKTGGGNTFFIPVDEGFKVSNCTSPISAVFF